MATGTSTVLPRLTVQRLPRHLALLQLHHPVSQGIVAIIVADDDDGLASTLELREEPLIEYLSIVRVLVRGPFIEDIDRPILEESGQESEALSLPLRERRRGKHAVCHADLRL